METKIFFIPQEAKAIDLEARTIRFLASTPDVDRDDEKILPTAFKAGLDTYKANPVILACHQHRLTDGSSPVVGRAEKIWVDARGLWVIVKFAQTRLAEEYWHLYRDGFMKSVSVGFSTKKSHEEVIEGKRVRVIDEVELYEISLVPVPANAGAVAKNAPGGEADLSGQQGTGKKPKRNFVEEKRLERTISLMSDEDKEYLSSWKESGFSSQKELYDFMVSEHGSVAAYRKACDDFAEAILDWPLDGDGDAKDFNFDNEHDDAAGLDLLGIDIRGDVGAADLVALVS